MRKKRKPQTLADAKKLYKLLLWNASNGNLGTEPEKAVNNADITFAEKRSLLDSIIKIAAMEAKSGEDEEVSGLDLIRSQLNGSRENRSSGDYERTESSSDDAGDSGEESADA